MVSLVRFWLFISQAIATVFLAAMTLIIAYGVNLASVQNADIGKFEGTIGVMTGHALIFIICSIRAWMLLKKEQHLRQAAIVTAIPLLLVPVAVLLMQ